MVKYKKLIKKLKKADKGSSALNIKISRILGYKEGHEWSRLPNGTIYAWAGCPKYTENIEDALFLLPEDWKDRKYIHTPGYDKGKLIDDVRVEIHNICSSGGGPSVIAFGATIPLAICIAAVKIMEIKND